MGCAEDRYGHAPYGTTPTGNQVITAQNNPTTGSATAMPEYSSASSESDPALVARIQQSLGNGALGFRPALNVSARNGVVYLSGTVPNESARLSVDNMVRNTTGVVSVQDGMSVANPPPGQTYSQSPTTTYSPTGPTYPPSSAYVTTATGDIFSLHVQGLNDTDRTLAQRVLEGLRTDTTLSNVMPSVNINIVNGRVLLQGTVQNERQRRAIVEAVQRAAGVQNVDDQLTVSR
jgi:osmotically-inducible protein OsmY